MKNLRNLKRYQLFRRKTHILFLRKHDQLKNSVTNIAKHLFFHNLERKRIKMSTTVKLRKIFGKENEFALASCGFLKRNEA